MRLELAIVPCCGPASKEAWCSDAAIRAQRLDAAPTVVAGDTCRDFSGQNHARRSRWGWLSGGWARVVQGSEQNLHACCCVFCGSPDVLQSLELSV